MDLDTETESEVGTSDFERALLTTILDEKAIKDVLNKKITPDYFSDVMTRAAYTFLVDWYNNPEYNPCPSWTAFTANFPDFEPLRTDDGIAPLVDAVREAKLYNDLVEVAQQLADGGLGDAKAGLTYLQTATADLTLRHQDDDTQEMSALTGMLLAEYERMKHSDVKLKGWPFPWDAFNNATLGAQRGQLGIVYGRPKTLKTWLALLICAYFAKQSLRVLVISMELTDIEVARRHAALMAHVNYRKMQRAELDKEQETVFFETIAELAELRNYAISNGVEGVAAAAVTAITAKVDEFQPDVVFIDGLYFLGEDWAQLSKVTRGLKKLAKAKKIFILGCTQANRSNQKKKTKKSDNRQDDADDFAYGDSFAQDADWCLRLTRGIEDIQQRQVTATISAIRDGAGCLFTINAKLCEDLTQKSVQMFSSEEEEEEAMADQDASDLPEDVEIVDESRIANPTVKPRLKLKKARTEDTVDEGDFASVQEAVHTATKPVLKLKIPKAVNVVRLPMRGRKAS